MPAAGTYDGRDEALGALAQAAEAFESIQVPFAHVWRMSDGVIKRGQILTDTSVVLQVLEG